MLHGSLQHWRGVELRVGVQCWGNLLTQALFNFENIPTIKHVAQWLTLHCGNQSWVDDNLFLQLQFVT